LDSQHTQWPDIRCIQFSPAIKPAHCRRFFSTIRVQFVPGSKAGSAFAALALRMQFHVSPKPSLALNP